MTQKKSLELKKKKKKWIPIFATKEFNSVELGETFVDENEKVIGKVLCANLMNLVKDPKRQNTQLYFIVRSVNNNEAQTELMGYEMVMAYLRRVTKKAEERVDHSFEAVSQDNVRFKIKPILMTKGVAHKSVATALRKRVEDFVSSTAKKTPFSELMKAVVSGSMQKEIKSELKKIYPLGTCMIKSFKKIQ